ncbi:hypothetical protein BD769DRAFT_1672593 [Suillus cothurnatus]|nr:hypothetical protein BD769DRAFT_1672593 [Suillus cothurnatus]
MHFKFTLSLEGFAKVIPILSKRSKNQGCTQHNSTTADHEGDTSIPTDLSNLVPAPIPSSNSSPVHPVSASGESRLEASINLSSTRYSGGVSLAREASDMAQVALPFVQAISGAIPLVGAPMQAAIGGLLTGLQTIDRHRQNKAGLDSLILRLNRLSLDLCNAPPAWDPVEQYRRDSFVRMLQDTSARVTALREHCLASTSVTQAIAGCFAEIDRYLADYLVWSSQIQSQRDTHEALAILRKEKEDRQKFLVLIESMVMRGQSSMGPSAAHLAGTVTLVDATGHHHAISVNFCTSYQQLNDMLPVLFKRDAIEAQIQRRYIEEGKYDLCIDEGTQVTTLTSDKWSSIEPGTKLVMRVTIQQKTRSGVDVDYKCHFCGAVNRLGIRSVEYYGSKRQNVCSTDCRECQRRFHITRDKNKEGTLPPISDSNHASGDKTLLIRNFHVEQIPVCDLVF